MVHGCQLVNKIRGLFLVSCTCCLHAYRSNRSEIRPELFSVKMDQPDRVTGISSTRTSKLVLMRFGN